jgi:hypothetical protein
MIQDNGKKILDFYHLLQNIFICRKIAMYDKQREMFYHTQAYTSKMKEMGLNFLGAEGTQ